MKPEKKNLLDFDSLSTGEMDALIEVLTVERNARINRDKRRKKAEEYEVRIYDLISDAQYEGFTIRINDESIPNDFTVDADY